jgi:hypothetical protein
LLIWNNQTDAQIPRCIQRWSICEWLLLAYHLDFVADPERGLMISSCLSPNAH